MADRTSVPARSTAAVLALMALGALLLQTIYLRDRFALGWAETLWLMALYFTTLTNLLAAASFAALACGRHSRHPGWLHSLVVSLILVGGVYHLLLSDLWSPDGIGLIADHGLHSAVPAAAFLWWLFFAPAAPPALRHLWLPLLWPALYTGYAVLRGLAEGRYPYPFLDPSLIGWPQVAQNLLYIAVVLLVLGVVLNGLARIARR
ncbi:Pr6Pr family membrane protein [Rhodophyticola porphyridii]|uniref:Pr6Pr family membrane protein n=1 Tax=Rhodophyticola porphyridii TaxID=1852017 RepID=A0A3L9XWU4_9RHOB|nr:Pr6Pr family membrane protein [Rhodophyticola porphyridii]RMA40782.1 hypothetical protein D9R08_17750 [Rhodophyticola porphyridii]